MNKKCSYVSRLTIPNGVITSIKWDILAPSKTRIIEFIFLALLTCTTSAERNECCQNKGTLAGIYGKPNPNCSNGETSWQEKTCTRGSYITLPEHYTLISDDELIYLYVFVEKERYCLGSLENETKIVAVICYHSIEDRNSSLMFGTKICNLISITCLSLTIIVYNLLPKLRDLQGKCIMMTVISLLFAYVLKVVISVLRENTIHVNTICLFTYSLQYFGSISSYFWINVVAFNIWRTTVRPKFLLNSKYIFTFYNIYGWGTPAILLIITLITEYIPGNHTKPGWTRYCGYNGWTKDYCGWFQAISKLIYFDTPILILTIMNIIMFISAGWNIWRYEKNNLTTEQSTNTRIHKSRKYKFILYLKLFLITSIVWTFGHSIDLFYKNGYYVWYTISVTYYLYALQGVIIFLVLVVFRKRVRRDLARRGGIICGKLQKDWALIPDEEMEELEDEMDEVEQVNEYNMQPL